MEVMNQCIQHLLRLSFGAEFYEDEYVEAIPLSVTILLWHRIAETNSRGFLQFYTSCQEVTVEIAECKPTI